MKRIDEKIKEIEKKDKKNRMLYIGFVVLIFAFMAYALSSEKKIKTQSETIESQDETIVSQIDTINMTKEQLNAINDSLVKVVKKLENSLTPEGYWADIEKIGTAKAYINYVASDDNGVQIAYRAEALEKIVKTSTDGTIGWLYCGKKSGEQLTSGKVTVKWRKDVAGVNSNVVPEVGDILQQKNESRYFYSNYNRAKKSKNKSGSWPLESRAYVLDMKMDGPAVYIKIKF
jgi:uncharacterized coiled-coil protein SlyX